MNTTTIKNNTALSKSSLRRAFCKKLDSAAWLAARYAHRVEKVEKSREKKNAKMVDLSKVFRRPVWELSRFEKFVQVAFDLRSAAWLAAR